MKLNFIRLISKKTMDIKKPVRLADKRIFIGRIIAVVSIVGEKLDFSLNFLIIYVPT